MDDINDMRSRELKPLNAINSLGLWEMTPSLELYEQLKVVDAF